MQLIEMMHPEGRVFFKSEAAPIRKEWPCVSFTRQMACEQLMNMFHPERDILIYVGTTNPEITVNPEYRSRLLSASVIDTSHILKTRELVSPEIWEKVTAKNDKRLRYALGIYHSVLMTGPPFPAARELAPTAYTALGRYINRGNIVEVKGKERKAVMSLPVVPINLNTVKSSQAHNILLPDDITRMANLILSRVTGSKKKIIKTNPTRKAPTRSELLNILDEKWHEQNGQCALCGGRLIKASINPMLQASPDRIDSSNSEYGRGNLQITHLACNLAKNQYGQAAFNQWLGIIMKSK